MPLPSDVSQAPKTLDPSLAIIHNDNILCLSLTLFLLLCNPLVLLNIYIHYVHIHIFISSRVFTF